MPGLKAKLAKVFLNFLDEHGDYRTQLEEAAARAAAAEANSLFAKDRRGRKKKKRKRGKLKDGEEGPEEEGAGGQGGAEGEEEEWEEDELLDIDGLLLSPPDQQQSQQPKHPQLPEDPYEQIQFYFQTFTHRTKLQLEEQVELFTQRTQNWIHDELHHETRVPLLSASMLATSILLWILRARRKKIGKVARVHGILGKKMILKDYLHTNIVKGRILLKFSSKGRELLDKLMEKAGKAEDAALASMRPYQRKKYERFIKLERLGDLFVTMCLLLGMVASGVTLGMSLNELYRGDYDYYNNEMMIMGGGNMSMNDVLGEGERLDGQLYAYDGPIDSDGYPIGMRELAEENYAACVLQAEDEEIEDPTSVCNVEEFFDEAVRQQQRERELEAATAKSTNNEEDEDQDEDDIPTSPLRTKLNDFLTDQLHFPPTLATYLTTLGSQTIAYLSSLFTFLLFLTSHWIAHKIHLATIENDPMKHFVLTATDKTIKADGTVEAKKGETEAQRKRRERMLQNERLKSKMAQLAMEAKQRVQERRERIEGAAAVEKEKEEAAKKVVEEQEEIIKLYGRQFGMLKAGVPEGAIINTLIAEGIDDENEHKEIIEKLKEVKARRAKEALQEEEAEAKKLEEEKKAEEEKDKIAAERLRQMKAGGGSSVGSSSFRTMNSMGSATANNKSSGEGMELKKKKTEARGAKPPASSDAASTTSTIATDPSVAKTALLSQISGGSAGGSGGGGAAAFGQTGLKSAALRKTPKSIPYNPAPRPGSSMIVSGNMPIGAKSDKRWDRESKSWVNAAIEAASPSKKDKTDVVSPQNNEVDASSSPRAMRSMDTPKKSNRQSSMKKKTKKGGEEEKKGEEESPIENNAAREARETIIKAAKSMPTTDDNSNESPPVLVRISSPDGKPLSPVVTTPATPADPFARPSARDIQAQITAVENEPENEGEGGGDLAPAWLHSPAFETALRNSNSSWDRRPSSRDVMARIKAVEQYEAQAETDAADEKNHRLSLTRIDERHDKADPRALQHATSFEFRRKASKSNANDPDDDDISELSEPTYVSSDRKDSSHIPQALFVPQSGGNPGLSPMVMNANAALSPEMGKNSRSLIAKDNMEQLMKLAEKGDLNMPDMQEGAGENEKAAKLTEPVKSEDKSTASSAEKVEEKVETEEEKKRRERAEARAKKIEAIAARRNAGLNPLDDDASAVSGISKRRDRLRRKKKKEQALAAMEETKSVNDGSVKSDAVSHRSDKSSVKVETEEEKKRRERAEARAKKLDGMAARRNAGLTENDDDTAVTGISKRHRLRRKKSALAAISPEQHERNEWKRNIFASVLNAEQVQWKKSIFSHVINAESTRENNIEAQRQLEEQNAAAQRLQENQKRIDKRAKKFASRAERFHKIRRDGGNDDDGASVVSSASRMRRRRGRKSTSTASVTKAAPVPAVEENAAVTIPAEPTAEEIEQQERLAWSNSIYTTVMKSNENQWKKSIYAHVLTSQNSYQQRIEMEAQIARERAAAEARQLKERQNELRAQKMERINKLRREGRTDGDDDGASVVSSASRMRRRRKKKIDKPQAAAAPVPEEENNASTPAVDEMANPAPAEGTSETAPVEENAVSAPREAVDAPTTSEKSEMPTAENVSVKDASSSTPDEGETADLTEEDESTPVPVEGTNETARVKESAPVEEMAVSPGDKVDVPATSEKSETPTMENPPAEDAASSTPDEEGTAEPTHFMDEPATETAPEEVTAPAVVTSSCSGDEKVVKQTPSEEKNKADQPTIDTSVGSTPATANQGDTAASSEVSSMKRMRNRRRKAAKKNKKKGSN